MSLGTVGTDTGGSIRIPAAACGIVGLKPEWGTDLRVRRRAAEPPTRSRRPARGIGLLTPGRCITRCCRRAAASARCRDARPSRALRLGVPSGYLFDRLDEDVERSVLGTIEMLRSKGATMTEVPLPHASDIATDLPASRVWRRGRVSRAHARIAAARLHAERAPASRDGALRAGGGLHPRAARQGDHRHGSGSRARRESTRWCCPALSIPAPPIGAATMPVKGGAEAVRTLMLRCTQPFNLSGHPAIALPCGTTPAGFAHRPATGRPQRPHAARWCRRRSPSKRCIATR